MKRVDLRHLKSEFLSELDKVMLDANSGEVVIFLFEMGDFTPVQKAIEHAQNKGYEQINSLKFNQTDWTLILKKASNEI